MQSQTQGHSAVGNIMSIKYSNDTLGNRMQVFPRNFLTNILRCLLYFPTERKPFELQTLVIFVFVYRTQLKYSINSKSAGLRLVLQDSQKRLKAKNFLRNKHDGKLYSVPTPTPSSYIVGIYPKNTCDIYKRNTRDNTGSLRGATGLVQKVLTSSNAAHERT